MTNDIRFNKMIKKLSKMFIIAIIAVMPLNIVCFALDSNNDNSKETALPASSLHPNALRVSANMETEDEYDVQEEQLMEIAEVSNEYSEYEVYELAKIIMAEAEGQSQECKEYIGQVIVNRVNSTRFPDTIHDVIFDGIQFTPTFNGRWERVEPNEDCYDAAYTVLNANKPLLDEDTMWFEAFYETSDIEDSWHYNNLELVAEVDGCRFYREK